MPHLGQIFDKVEDNPWNANDAEAGHPHHRDREGEHGGTGAGAGLAMAGGRLFEAKLQLLI